MKKGFIVPAIILAGAALAASAVFVFSELGSDGQDFLASSQNPQWVEKAGEGLIAPACASSNPSTYVCDGTTPKVTISFVNESGTMCNYDLEITGIKARDNIEDFTLQAGGVGSWTFSGVNGGSYLWSVFSQDHCNGTGNYDFVETGGLVEGLNCAAYTLTVNSSGASGVAITSSTGHGGTTNYSRTGLTSGTAVSLTAPATSGGMNFSSWTGCDSVSGNTCNVTMNADRTVTANYVAQICGNGVDVGLRIYENNAVRKIAVVPDGAGISKLKIQARGSAWEVVTVDPSDPNASKMRIQTPAGIRALCLLP